MLRRRDEAKLERDIRNHFGGPDYPDVLLCPNEVGNGYRRAVLDDLRKTLPPATMAVVEPILRRHRVSYGLGVGSPDLALWVSGRSALVELKTEEGRLSEDQERWHAAAGRRGVRIDVVRSVAAMEAVVAELRRGEEWGDR
jgi:hypothetical protein